MRTLYISIAIVALAFIILFLYVSRWSPEAKLAHRNYENSLKIKPGMSLNDMLFIMGKPYVINKIDDSYTYQDTLAKDYIYDLGIGAADGIHIIVDSTKGVIMVFSSD